SDERPETRRAEVEAVPPDSVDLDRPRRGAADEHDGIAWTDGRGAGRRPECLGDPGVQDAHQPEPGSGVGARERAVVELAAVPHPNDAVRAGPPAAGGPRRHDERQAVRLPGDEAGVAADTDGAPP